MPNFYKIDDFRHFDEILRPVQMPLTSIELFKLIKTDTKKLFNSVSDIFLIMQALLTKFFCLKKKKNLRHPPKNWKCKIYRYLHGFFKVIFLCPIFFKTLEKVFKRKSVIIFTKIFVSVVALDTSFTKFGCHAKCQISTKWTILDILIGFQGPSKCLSHQLNYLNLLKRT